MIFRAFSRDLPRCGDRAHCKKQKTRHRCNFFATADSSPLLKALNMPFLLRFRASICFLTPCDNPQSQKSCNPSRYFVFELLEQSRDSTGGCCGPGVGQGGSGAGPEWARHGRCGPGAGPGVVDPAQARGLWTRGSTGRGRLGAMLGEGWADPMRR